MSETPSSDEKTEKVPFVRAVDTEMSDSVPQNEPAASKAPAKATDQALDPDDLVIKNDLKFRESLYRMMISQLFYDGYQSVAISLSNVIQASPPCPPSNKLFNLIKVAVLQEIRTNKVHQEDQLIEAINVVATNARKANKSYPGDGEIDVVAGLDFDFESDKIPTSVDAAQYDTCYVTSHKAACRAAAFDKLGTVIATGSVDASIKILDVERMLVKGTLEALNIEPTPQQQSAENHPVIRTLYDHADEITALEFHPYEPILASGSRDYTVKFFEYAKPSTKKAFKCIQEAEQIRCLGFHPSGDWLLVATQHPTLRLYRVETSQCYVSSVSNDQHKLPVTSLQWSPNARVFATGSKDGSIKLWDSVSNKCINTFINAHSHQEVCSVAFTSNSKYLLSSGKDSVIRLWELSTARCLISYTGAGSAGKQEKRTQATFNHTEDYIFYPDEKTTTLCCWDSRNAQRQNLLSLGHNSVVKCMVHSPTAPHFISCSDDYRARFWCKRSLIGLDN